jgi:hypothetical protein
MRIKSRAWLIVIPLSLLATSWGLVSVFLYSHLERKDWLPIVLSGLGLLVALGTAVWTSLEQRKHLTLGVAVTLWQRWSDADMMSVRNVAWDALRNAKFSNGKKRIGNLRAESPDQYKAIARLNHFLADLNDLICANLVDAREARALFRDTLQAYYCHLLFVTVADTFDDGTGESQQQWFDQKVLGLGRLLNLSTSSDFQRYRTVFDANESLSKQTA